MAYVNIPDSNLAGSFAGTIGSLQSDLTTKATKTINNLLEEISKPQSCLDQRRLERVSGNLERLKGNIDSFKNRVNKINKIAPPLRTTARAFGTIITILKAIPIPQSVPPGFGIPVNVTIKFADKLHEAKEFVKQLNDDATAITNLTDSNSIFFNSIERLSRKLNAVDRSIKRCREVQENIRIQTLKSLRNQQLNGTLTGGLPSFLIDSNNIDENISILLSSGSIPFNDTVLSIFNLQPFLLENIILPNLRNEQVDTNEPFIRNLLTNPRSQDLPETLKEFFPEDLFNTQLDERLLSKEDENSLKSNERQLNNQITGDRPETLEYTATNGQRFIFEIIPESRDTIAPLRFIRAKRLPSREIVYEGEKSYSSSVQILIKEAKFEIENRII